MNLPSEFIKKLAGQAGADLVGIARADIVSESDKYRERLAENSHGDMHYLKKNLEKRFDPRLLLTDAQSIIAIAVNYYSPDSPENKQAPFKVARYAWGQDYHIVLRNILTQLNDNLKSLAPRMKSKLCIDTAPFADVYWAEKAGLGWRGKHSALVTREYGCWVSLGALVITAETDTYDLPAENHCGTCRACIESCPTCAIINPYELIADKCISYWNIESRADSFPENITGRLNGWIFGCDICIGACPYNRFARNHKLPAFDRDKHISILETGRISRLSEEEFRYLFKSSPISRPKWRGILRNFAAAQSAGK